MYTRAHELQISKSSVTSFDSAIRAYLPFGRSERITKSYIRFQGRKCDCSQPPVSTWTLQSGIRQNKIIARAKRGNHSTPDLVAVSVTSSTFCKERCHTNHGNNVIVLFLFWFLFLCSGTQRVCPKSPSPLLSRKLSWRKIFTLNMGRREHRHRQLCEQLDVEPGLELLARSHESRGHQRQATV